MRYYIISGEASGDLHGSNLIKELVKIDRDADIRAWGGDLMESAGANVVKHYKDLAFMGFTEVLLNLKTILTNIDFCKSDILQYNPDVLILIDYPGFNLRIAKFAQEKGLKVYYYISPQIWAWKQSRVKQIKAYVDEMFVILPFEKEFYKKFGVDVDFVGHPLIDAVEQFKLKADDREAFINKNTLDVKPIVALLPGSRKQEISKMLPIMLRAAENFPDYQFVVAGAPSQDAHFYQSFFEGKSIKIVFGSTYELLTHAHSALVTSGTATLETAIFQVPQVVCYKGGYISYLIARVLIKVKFISLVNLIMDRMVVKELIQKDMNSKNLISELKKISDNGEPRDTLLSDYGQLKTKLGGGGASKVTANLVFKTLSESKEE